MSAVHAARRIATAACVVTLAAALVTGAPAHGADPAAAPAAPDADRPPTVAYSHGDPSDDEQLLLELMNRARRDPAAEGRRIANDYGIPLLGDAVDYFLRLRPGVEFTRRENRDAFARYAPQPPFAFSPKLLAAARRHTARMKSADEQSHQLPGEDSLGTRLRSHGYAFAIAGESVFATATSVLHAHAGFAVDYGQERRGARPYLGHRNALMNFDGTEDFVEVGVGLATDLNPATHVGPKLVTIDFGRAGDAERFVTGICHLDADGDGFYDPGEGLEGVRIESPASAWHTVSSASGGFALPVPANAGAIRVTATGLPGRTGEIVGRQTFDLTVGTGNVRLVVTGAADPPPPAFVEFTGPGGGASAAATAYTIHAAAGPAADAAAAGAEIAAAGTVGALEATVDLDHDATDGLRIVLRSPLGTEVRLFDGGLPTGHGVSGTFGRTLVPAESLGAFAGEPFEGTWTLRVENAAPGATGTLAGWGLRVRPAWVRPLHHDVSGLRLRAMTAAGGGALSLVATIDAGGAVYRADAPALLRLVDARTGGEIARHDLRRDAAALHIGFGATSQADLRATLAGLDPAALPDRVRVEVSVGGTVVAQTVPLAQGSYAEGDAEPVTRALVIDRLTSRPRNGTRTTTFAGRIPAGLEVTGLVELFAGDAVVRIPAAAMRARGRIRAYTATGTALRRFALNPQTGAFTATIVTPHSAVIRGVVPLGVRVGTSYFDAVVRPSVRSGVATY